MTNTTTNVEEVELPTIRFPFCTLNLNQTSTDGDGNFFAARPHRRDIVWYMMTSSCRKHLIISLMVVLILFLCGLVTSFIFWLGAWKTKPPKIRGPGKLLSYESKRLRKYLKTLWAVSAIRMVMSTVSFLTSCILLPLICFNVFTVVSSSPAHVDALLRTNLLLQIVDSISCGLLLTLISTTLLMSMGQLMMRIKAVSEIEPERYLARKCNLQSMLSPDNSDTRQEDDRKRFSLCTSFYLVITVTGCVLVGAVGAAVVKAKLVVFGEYTPDKGSILWVGGASSTVSIVYILLLLIPIFFMVLLLPIAVHKIVNRRKRALAMPGYAHALTFVKKRKHARGENKRDGDAAAVKRPRSKSAPDRRKGVVAGPAAGVRMPKRQTKFSKLSPPHEENLAAETDEKGRHGSVFALVQDMSRASRIVPLGSAQAYFGEMNEIKAAAVSCAIMLFFTLPLVALLISDIFAASIVNIDDKLMVEIWSNSAIPCLGWYALGTMLHLYSNLPFSFPLRHSVAHLPCFRRSKRKPRVALKCHRTKSSLSHFETRSFDGIKDRIAEEIEVVE